MNWKSCTTIACCLASLLFVPEETNAYPPPPPEVVAEELNQAQRDFHQARKMFNPWYSGPLITGSAHNLDPGYLNIQPYLYVIDNYGIYNKDRHSESIDDLIQVEPQIVLQTGLLPRLDITAILSGFYNKQNGIDSGGYNDTVVQLGYQLVKETAYVPAVRFVFSESFPSGKYNDLNPAKRGLDAIGSGSYETTFTINFGKVVWWLTTHPMALRYSLNFMIPTSVHVRNFNSYGGGYGTHGKIKPGKQFTNDFGFEYSFTQKWVFALDLVYFYQGKARFSGNPGVDAAGNPAANGRPFSDQLSLAPAIEYNPSSTIGILGGAWFSVYGRSSFNFASAVISYYQVF
jgi:hypothetical protein